MKIALITDTHFGARSDSIHFDDFFKKFYDNVFFEYIVKHNIKHVIHLGDVFDRRKYINFNILNNCKSYFFDKLKELDIETHVIVGNHDTYFKNTNDVNSPDLLLNSYNNITKYSTPTEVTFENCKVLLLPWICTDNYELSIQTIKNTDAKIVFGHLEIAGFQMYKGQVNEHGFDRAIFDKFDQVYTGHFHHRSSNQNISYLGTAYEITWSDYADKKGFHIFDTDTQMVSFLPNPFIMFEKYYYDEDKEHPDSVDTSMFSGKHVKLIVVNKKDYALFDSFIERIYKKNPLELKIIEDLNGFESDALDDNIDLEDTMVVLSKYVDSIETDLDKNKLKTMLKSIYFEAQGHSV